MRQPSIALAFVSLVLGLVSCASAAGPETELPDCETADACLQQLRSVSGLKSGVGADDQALVARLLSFGQEIVPALVDILSDPNESAAELAAYALRDTPHIDARFLPEIRAGLDRDLGWLAPALCRMEGDAAAREAVSRYVVSESAPHNQEAYALELCGRRAIPHIVEAARCRISCAPDVYWKLAAVLGEMGEASIEAAPGLMKVLREAGTPHDVSVGVLAMVGALGAPARHLESELLLLREQRPELAVAIDQALVGIEAQAASRVFVERLATEADPLTLRDLAEIGAVGEPAGAVVVALLDDANWDTRIAAARTLGFIGYVNAVGPLIRLLDDPTDVRLNWAAAESLGRLGAQEAVPALRAAAASHWYPPVRSAATAAIEHIERQVPYERPFHAGNFAFEFFDYQHLGRDQSICEKPLPRHRPESEQWKLHSSSAPEALKALAYVTTAVSFGAPEQAAQPVGETGKVIELTPDNIVELRTPTEQIPQVALRVDNGWLVGSDRGEWGGELVYIDDSGDATTLLEENVEDIYSLGENVIALTGLAHLTLNHGTLQVLTRDAAGTWSARPWRSLPGAPQSSWLVDTGELLINVVSGGSLLLHQNGTFRMAPCEPDDSTEANAANAPRLMGASDATGHENSNPG